MDGNLTFYFSGLSYFLNVNEDKEDLVNLRGATKRANVQKKEKSQDRVAQNKIETTQSFGGYVIGESRTNQKHRPGRDINQATLSSGGGESGRLFARKVCDYFYGLALYVS